MQYIAQLIVMFLLAWAATYSLRIWVKFSAALLGWVLIPLILVILIIGEGAGWSYIGYVIVWLLNQISGSFQSIPFLAAGTLLGILHGLDIR